MMTPTHSRLRSRQLTRRVSSAACLLLAAAVGAGCGGRQPTPPGGEAALLVTLLSAGAFAVIGFVGALVAKRRRFLLGLLAALAADVAWRLGEGLFERFTLPPMPAASKSLAAMMSLLQGQAYAPTWKMVGTELLVSLPLTLLTGLVGVGAAWLFLRRRPDSRRGGPLRETGFPRGRDPRP